MVSVNDIVGRPACSAAPGCGHVGPVGWAGARTAPAGVAVGRECGECAAGRARATAALIAAFVGVAAVTGSAGVGCCTASIDCRASIDLHQQEEHSREGRTKHHSYPRVGRSRRKACRGKGGRVGGACGQGIDGEGPAAQALCLGGLRIWPSRATTGRRVCSVARVRRARRGCSRESAKRAGVTARRGRRVRAPRQGPGHTSGRSLRRSPCDEAFETRRLGISRTNYPRLAIICTPK